MKSFKALVHFARSLAGWLSVWSAAEAAGAAAAEDPRPVKCHHVCCGDAPGQWQPVAAGREEGNGAVTLL